MERLLRPERFETDPNSTTTSKEWLYWYRTFSNFSRALLQTNEALDLLTLLSNYVAPQVYDYIAECAPYDAAINTL